MRIAIVMLALVLAACSTKPVVTDITGAEDKMSIPGVPFRVKQQYVTHIYKLDEDKDAYSEVSRSLQLFPNLEKLYTISFQGDLFATRSIQVGENSDNTLKSIQVTSTNNTSALLDAVNSGFSGVTKAEADKKALQLTNDKAALDAIKAVKDAQKDLDSLSATASADTVYAYQQAVIAAKRQANDTYVSIGRAKPYPDLP